MEEGGGEEVGPVGGVPFRELRRSIERDQAAVSRLLLDNNIESVDAGRARGGGAA